MDDRLYTIRVLVEIYIIIKFTSLINEKIILLFILNIINFYAPLETKCPNFLFKCRITFTQVIEGLGLIDCLIPKYEEKTNEKK